MAKPSRATTITAKRQVGGTHRLTAVERTVSVLAALGVREAKSVSEVAALTGLSRATTHRFLRTLEALGAVVRAEPGGYALGMLLAELGARVDVANIVASASRPHLVQLTERYAEASFAVTRERNKSRTVAYIQSYRSTVVGRRTELRLPLTTGAGGRVLLAGMSAQELAELSARNELERQVGKRTSQVAFLRELDGIRGKGYAICRDEYQRGIVALAVPVKDLGGRWIAAIGLGGPVHRMKEPFLSQALSGLKRTSREITASFASMGGFPLAHETRRAE
jgi:IclR family pca regulon transcriptional regulator